LFWLSSDLLINCLTFTSLFWIEGIYSIIYKRGIRASYWRQTRFKFSEKFLTPSSLLYIRIRKLFARKEQCSHNSLSLGSFAWGPFSQNWLFSF
jgi:hypothetical protein